MLFDIIWVVGIVTFILYCWVSLFGSISLISSVEPTGIMIRGLLRKRFVTWQEIRLPLQRINLGWLWLLLFRPYAEGGPRRGHLVVVSKSVAGLVQMDSIGNLARIADVRTPLDFWRTRA